MSEPSRPDTVQGEPNPANSVLFIKVLVLTVCLYPLIYYTVFYRGAATPEIAEKNETSSDQDASSILPVLKEEILVVEEPGCPISEMVLILRDVCREFVFRSQTCSPEDVDDLEKHKIPPRSAGMAAKNNTTAGEPRGTIVGCIAAGLLLTSLGAAFVELYKAKSQTPAKSKPSMSRKCSLADLTVLKHHRKELSRRESILEMPETAQQQLGRKVSRPPLRLD